MTDNNVAGPTTGSGWPFWDAAVQRFTLGYGDPPDLTDPEDVAALLPLVREAVVDEVGRELVQALEVRTERLREEIMEVTR
jgi:hypothetical protein